MDGAIGITSALVGLVAGVLGVLKILDMRSKRQQREAIGAAFQGIVASLAGTGRVERLGSAILLRRFFSPDSEYAKPDMPYADAAIDVIAATLRGEPDGDVQKVLADGLSYVGVRSLRHKDFQQVNLRGGYLSLSGSAGHAVVALSNTRRATGLFTAASRSNSRKSSGREKPRLRLDVSGADFFGADLSGGSFAENICEGSVFYGATAVGTVFKGADLTGADFRDADVRRAKFDGAELKGAKFDGAKLEGAKFADARSIPREIADHLDDNYTFMALGDGSTDRARVFVSAPSVSTPADLAVIEMICTSLQDEGYEAVRVSRQVSHPERHLIDVRDAMAQCGGVVVVGVPQLMLASGSWRDGTADQQALTDEVMHTPWNDIEAGMGVGLGIPVLSIRAGCGQYGVFGLSSQNVGFERIDVTDSWTAEQLSESVRDWTNAAVVEPHRTFPSS